MDEEQHSDLHAFFILKITLGMLEREAKRSRVLLLDNFKLITFSLRQNGSNLGKIQTPGGMVKGIKHYVFLVCIIGSKKDKLDAWGRFRAFHLFS